MIISMCGARTFSIALLVASLAPAAWAQSTESSFQSDPNSAITLSTTITVEGTAPRDDYRADTATTLGALGPVRLLDLPYSVSVLPGEVLTNGQVKNVKEASKYLPLVEFQEMQGSEILRPATRGMQGSNMQNARMDGMGIVVTGANSIESLQQIEVLNGIGGALYGPANPSGIFNFVPKRPTATPVRRIAVDYDGRSIATGQADIGGRFGPAARFGYRVNALAGDGESYAKGSSLNRTLISAAGDVRPFDHTSIDAFFSRYQLVQRGFPGWFTYGRSSARSAFVLVPEHAPDPTTPGLGQHEAGVDLTSRIAQARVRQAFGRKWILNAGILDQRVDRDISTQVNALTDNAGNYTASLASGFAPRFTVLSNLSHLNGTASTGRVSHELAIATTGYVFTTYSDVTNPSAAAVRLGAASIAQPVPFALPAAGLPSHVNLFTSSTIHQQGVSVADRVVLGAGWSVRAAVSQDWIWTDNYNSTQTRTGGYTANGVSPLVSVMFKPRARMTLYATWGSSLQQGDVAPGTAVNSGQGLAPYRSHQEEAGYKIAFRTIDVSAAVFRLERPFATVDVVDNTFRLTGNQVNYGVEATIAGRLSSRLVTYGGFTALTSSLSDTPLPDADGKRFVGIPSWKSNLLTEYRLPAMAATFVTVNWQLVGRRPIDDVNTRWTPAYHVVDLGARYARTVGPVHATWRANVNNVGDVRYWSTLGPGNITGTNVGSYTAHLGSPRTVAVSMEVAF